MKSLATTVAIAVMIAVIIAGLAVAILDTWGPKPRPDHGPKPHAVNVVRLGPDGTDRTSFGDNAKKAIIRGSNKYDFCFGEMQVQRPSMLTTDMPTSHCTVTRGSKKGPWRITTGGWQTCQAVCISIRP